MAVLKRIDGDIVIDDPAANTVGEILTSISLSNNDSGYDLRELDLKDMDLEGVVFRGLIMDESTFKNSNLKNTNFTSANAPLCNFTNADFTGADISDTRFWSSIFINTIFTNVVGLDNADFDEEANFTGATHTPSAIRITPWVAWNISRTVHRP